MDEQAWPSRRAGNGRPGQAFDWWYGGWTIRIGGWRKRPTIGRGPQTHGQVANELEDADGRAEVITHNASAPPRAEDGPDTHTPLVKSTQAMPGVMGPGQG